MSPSLPDNRSDRGVPAAGRSTGPGALRPGRREGCSTRRVALVTGGSSGIGAAVAERLAADGGWDLLLSGRDRERLDETALRTGGLPLPGDLVAPGGCERLVREALGAAGRVDLFVASAGLGWAGPFTAMPRAAVDEILALDLSAVVHLVRLLLPGMIERGTGRIVLVGSIAGAVGVREEAVYSAAKAAVGTFGNSLRYELTGTGVRVCVIAPGAVDTPFFARRGTAYHRAWPRSVPASRVADAVSDAIRNGRDEVFVPGWLRLPARLNGMAPGVFRRLAARFG